MQKTKRHVPKQIISNSHFNIFRMKCVVSQHVLTSILSNLTAWSASNYDAVPPPLHHLCNLQYMIYLYYLTYITSTTKQTNLASFLVKNPGEGPVYDHHPNFPPGTDFSKRTTASKKQVPLTRLQFLMHWE